MTKERAPEPTAQSTSGRTAAEKLRIVMAAAALPGDELGAFLRREGVHDAELEQWRSAVLDAGRRQHAMIEIIEAGILADRSSIAK